MIMPRVAARIFDAPLLIDERKAAAILAGLGGRIVEGGVVLSGNVQPFEHVAFSHGRPSLGHVGDGLGRAFDQRGRLPFDLIDGIAVIPVEGTLVHKGAFVGQSSGETSYQGLQVQATRARRSDQVRGAVFEHDSFGGEAAGAFETADIIAQLSAEKPTISILSDFSLSGSYLLASATRAIIAPEFGASGSVGVLRMHVDYSRALENQGVKVTLITAGKRKAEGNEFAPLPAEVAQRMTAEAEQMRQVFAQHVARYRGGRITLQQVLDTEAGSFRSSDALSLGLIDGIGKPNDAFAAFIAEVNRRG